MQIVEWHRINVAFTLRMAYLGEKLTYEERLQRMEELLWIRDELRQMIEEKEYAEPASIYDSAKASQATASTGATQLECSQSGQWASGEASFIGPQPPVCGRCSQSGKPHPANERCNDNLL